MEIVLSDSDCRVGIKDYFVLMKPRVMSLAVFTGVVGMMLAPGKLEPVTMLAAVMALGLGGGAAGAFNMWLEGAIDARMERTRNRPIPAGRVSPASAFGFAVLCVVTSFFVMAIEANLLAALLLLTAILFYVFIYTIWLKPRTPMSIVIGGAAGALPPVIGWAATTGNISLEPLILFLIIFLWTPPHFWTLALVRAENYRRADIPALPVIAGRKSTMRQIVLYTLALVPVTLLPFMFGMSGMVYALGAGLLGAGFIFQAVCLWWKQDNRYAMSMFIGSLLYLTGIFALLIVDRIFYA
jgi:protoheme IX farnesyltransferase